MKIKNSEILTLFEAINMLENVKPDLPIKVFYANNKNRNILSTPFDEINKTRMKLLEKYGIIDKESQFGFKLEKDNRTFAFKSKDAKKSFEEDLKPIMDEEVDVAVHKLSIEEFNGIDIERKSFPLLDIYLQILITD